MAVLETIIGSALGVAIISTAAGVALQRLLRRRRSKRVAVMIVDGRAPYGRLPNYFLPGVRHPSELRGAELAGATTDPFGSSYIDWVAENRGAPCGSSYFKIAMQCIGDANVTLVNGRAIVDRFDNGPGIAVRYPAGGPVDVYHLRVNLESGAVECYPAGCRPGIDPPIGLDFRIEPHAGERFDVYAHVGVEAVRWYLEFDFMIDGRKVTKKVRPPERWFATVPTDYDRIVDTFYPSDRGWVAASDRF